jgi:hypothetical protein
VKRLVVILAAVAALGGLAACTPEGQSCHRAGDVKVQDGKSYTCTDTGPEDDTGGGGLEWK